MLLGLFIKSLITYVFQAKALDLDIRSLCDNALNSLFDRSGDGSQFLLKIKREFMEVNVTVKLNYHRTN